MDYPRLKIWNADHSEYLGEGILLGVEEVEFDWRNSGFFDLLEDPPLAETGKINVSKIKLDSGEIMYGYETWWVGITKEDHEKALEMIK